jgi:hypothetical protein
LAGEHPPPTADAAAHVVSTLLCGMLLRLVAPLTCNEGRKHSMIHGVLPCTEYLDPDDTMHAHSSAVQFKRPTPSISVLLGSIPPVHGKLPPLRSSADGGTGRLQLCIFSIAHQQHASPA